MPSPIAAEQPCFGPREHTAAVPRPGDEREGQGDLGQVALGKGPAERGSAFVYRGVRFLTDEGILRWVAANGNHIPVNAAPSGGCRKCTSLRVEEGKRRHWHFLYPHRL